MMRRETIRVLVLGRFEARWQAVMTAIQRSDTLEVVAAGHTADVIVELRHPQDWKMLPRGKRFPAVVVVPQEMSPCSKDEALSFHADAFIADTDRLVETIIKVHYARKHPKSA